MYLYQVPFQVAQCMLFFMFFIVVCENDLSSLYKHVIGALDSYGGKVFVRNFSVTKRGPASHTELLYTQALNYDSTTSNHAILCQVYIIQLYALPHDVDKILLNIEKNFVKECCFP